MEAAPLSAPARLAAALQCRRTQRAARRLLALAEGYEPTQRSLAEDLRAAAHAALAEAAVLHAKQHGARSAARPITATPPSPAGAASR